MKRIGIVLLAALLAGGARGDVLAVDTQEVGGAIGMGNASDFRLTAYYAYTMAYGFTFGPMAGASTKGGKTTGCLGVRGTHNFNIGEYSVPYLGLGALFGSGQDVGFVLRGDAGMKFFLEYDFALTTAIVLELATDKVWGSEDNSHQANLGVEVGLAYYF